MRSDVVTASPRGFLLEPVLLISLLYVVSSIHEAMQQRVSRELIDDEVRRS